MVKPISLRIRAREVTADARRLLRRLDKEAAAQRQFRHFAAKGFLAASEMRAALEQLPPGDRATWEAETKRIESVLLKISRGLR